MIIEDHFEGQGLPRWVRYAVGAAVIEQGASSLRFVVEGATPDVYADAQIDDYHGLSRKHLPWRPPLRLTVRARASHAAGALLGTAGFGFWNDPFTLSGGMLAAPNAIWFFYASPPSNMALAPPVPGWGWKAAALNSGPLPGWLLAPAALAAAALLKLPGVNRLLRPWVRAAIKAGERLLDVDLREWHTYTLEWRRDEAAFWVDEAEVLRVSHPPSGPLGFVAWLDNQYAVATLEGDFRFGLLAVSQRQWLELDYVRIERMDD
jgi:hypothetical protein